MAAKAASTKIVPPAPVLVGASAPIKRALVKVLAKKRRLDDYAKTSRALGDLLAKDDAAREQLHAIAASLARDLTSLGAIEKLGPKKRAPAFERVDALEWIVTTLRCAGAENDAQLITLADSLTDGPQRGRILAILRGGQISLPANSDAALAALFATSTEEVSLRCSFGALWDRDEKAARAVSKRILEDGTDAKRITCVLNQLEHAETDHAAWTSLVAPLVISDSRSIRIEASAHFTRQRLAFHAFVAWVQVLTDGAQQRRALAELAPQIYWAYIANQEIRDELVEPLRALRERAVATKDSSGVKAIDAAAKKTGIALGVAKAAKMKKART